MKKRHYRPPGPPIARTPYGEVWWVPSVGRYYELLTTPEKTLVTLDDEDGSMPEEVEQEVGSFWTGSLVVVCMHIGHTDKDPANPVVIDEQGQYTII